MAQFLRGKSQTVILAQYIAAKNDALQKLMDEMKADLCSADLSAATIVVAQAE